VGAPSNTPIFDAACELERACAGAGFAFCFVGGIAVQRWGKARPIADVNAIVHTGYGTEARFVDALLGTFTGRTPDARAAALRRRKLLLAAKNGTAIDVSLGGMPFEEHAVTRASAFDFGDGITLTTCTAEDLVIHKAFAGREKDWVDIQTVVARQGAALDVALIWEELLPLVELKNDAATEERLRKLLAAH
jgi:hypothetical protein